MNEEIILSKIELIKKVAEKNDDEVAHSLEDSLHQLVLRSISNGECEDPKACAKLALSTNDIVFSRWFA